MTVTVNDYQCAVAVNELGKVVAVSLPSRKLKPRLNLSFLSGRREAIVKSFKTPFNALVREVAEKLVEAFKGHPVSFNCEYSLSYLTPFVASVLNVVAKVPRGKVISYGSVAYALGNPKASRGVGVALSINPLPLIIPCHRVVKSDGSIGGYSYGVKIKEQLLKREGVVVRGGFVPRSFFMRVLINV